MALALFNSVLDGGAASSSSGGSWWSGAASAAVGAGVELGAKALGVNIADRSRTAPQGAITAQHASPVAAIGNLPPPTKPSTGSKLPWIIGGAAVLGLVAVVIALKVR